MLMGNFRATEDRTKYCRAWQAVEQMALQVWKGSPGMEVTMGGTSKLLNTLNHSSKLVALFPESSIQHVKSSNSGRKYQCCQAEEQLS